MPRPPPPLGLIYSFGRSGSTLLNQCLGCQPANAVLSEVNPAGSYFDVAWQAQHWLGLASAEESAALEKHSYAKQVDVLADACRRADRHLIIRDWTAVNFLQDVMPGVEPSAQLEQEWYLAGTGRELRRVVFCRRAQAVYSSYCSNFPQFRDLRAADFARAYFAYAEAVHAYPAIHLEDFTSRPSHWLKEICQLLDVAFPADFADKFADYRNCTGNTTLATDASSTKLRSIVPVKPPLGAPAHPLFSEADQLLGYEST